MTVNDPPRSKHTKPDFVSTKKYQFLDNMENYLLIYFRNLVTLSLMEGQCNRS